MIAGARWATQAGPLAEEPIRGTKINVTNCQLHEDPIHRGPAQVMPMTRRAIWGAFLSAEPTLLEPWINQKRFIKLSPKTTMGSCSPEVEGRNNYWAIWSRTLASQASNAGSK